jgi:hypothetical protein
MVCHILNFNGRVMHYKLSISHYDIKELLAELSGSKRAFDAELNDGSSIENCRVDYFDELSDTVALRQPFRTVTVSIYSIRHIQFPGFYAYKGIASRAFVPE